jgi:hypothetical protein
MKTAKFGQTERRQRRSSQTPEALGLLLGARAKSRGSQTLVVGTIDGLVIAAPGGTDGDLVAAFGACSERGQALGDSPRLSTCALEYENTAMVLTAVGGPHLKPQELENDVKRVLNERSVKL